MKLFGDARMLRGSITWGTSPLRVRWKPQPIAAPLPAAETLSRASLPEYDEDGRLFVFRYARTSPQQYTIERDRIFEYMKRRKLPDMEQRQIRRDLRNAANFFTDVRELQTDSITHPCRAEASKHE